MRDYLVLLARDESGRLAECHWYGWDRLPALPTKEEAQGHLDAHFPASTLERVEAIRM